MKIIKKRSTFVIISLLLISILYKGITSNRMIFPIYNKEAIIITNRINNYNLNLQHYRGSKNLIKQITVDGEKADDVSFYSKEAFYITKNSNNYFVNSQSINSIIKDKIPVAQFERRVDIEGKDIDTSLYSIAMYQYKNTENNFLLKEYINKNSKHYFPHYLLQTSDVERINKQTFDYELLTKKLKEKDIQYYIDNNNIIITYGEGFMPKAKYPDRDYLYFKNWMSSYYFNNVIIFNKDYITQIFIQYQKKQYREKAVSLMYNTCEQIHNYNNR